MELKLIILGRPVVVVPNFNRTNMELKLLYLILVLMTGMTILIAPIWNWNYYYQACLILLFANFNRTNMELKRRNVI